MAHRETSLAFSASRPEALRHRGAFVTSLFGALVVSCLLANPAPCSAEGEEPPSVFGYALSGFGTGAATGFAIGYLATGPKWESDEWRTLLWGGGIGALTGMGIGIVLGVVDAGTTPAGRGVGFYVMRDSNYGLLVGAAAGLVIGSLYWAGGGTSKDVLIGGCWGTVIGAGSGMILGVVEGVLRRPAEKEQPKATETETTSLRLDLGFLPSRSGAPSPYPVLSGRF